MTELDLSGHPLNTSISKNRYSFSKNGRFKNVANNVLCDSFYEVPSTRSKRSTSFGYGNKSIGLVIDKNMAPVGCYDSQSDFKSETKRGFSFGKGREQMEITGPMKESLLTKYIPGPGKYEIKQQKQTASISLKSRIPDKSLDYLQKIPGPGAYKVEQIGHSNYYISSRHKNATNGKFSQKGRNDPPKGIKTEVSPVTYSLQRESINPNGNYVLSKHQNSKTRQFEKSPRPSMAIKHMATTPGPGQYKCFSSFSAI